MHSARERESAPPIGSAAASRRGGRQAPSHRGSRRRTSHRRGRPRRRAGRYLLMALVALGLLGSGMFFLGGGQSDASSHAPQPRRVAHLTHSPTPPPTPTPTPTPTPSPTEIAVPATGSGTFTTARAGGAKVGRGAHLIRYAVQVETGLDVSPDEAAQEIADILAAPRGWTHSGNNSFRLVGAGESYDLMIKIATAGTADALCWAGIHQDTHGEYNCEIPGGVVVNLKRWVKGSPTFDGPIHDYRALIINHEMGHSLGLTHMTCAGPGQLAPVMMQQIKGLHGCVANAWPYDKSGHYVSGPHVP
ncbi:DUF3152 domain-containing protein [Streptomyces sp. MI02-7b]|uniref:DUF3152 domain-containing protein n=1 Tax=Streptomyces sp. MI02-7b TaxID=462941 RepID=UPI0029BEA27A|nr:DUF3152 domain-containing protein [Streptomyces sp. MI02-7b]MDX3076145.1 DUF3152 domain-containing protein [Streptomyces sp. MI02-7b]